MTHSLAVRMNSLRQARPAKACRPLIVGMDCWNVAGYAIRHNREHNQRQEYGQCPERSSYRPQRCGSATGQERRRSQIPASSHWATSHASWPMEKAPPWPLRHKVLLVLSVLWLPSIGTHDDLVGDVNTDNSGMQCTCWATLSNLRPRS